MVVLGISTAAALAYGIALFAVMLLIPGAITLLKGQILLFFAGLLLGGAIVWWIVAFRIARPDSWWARNMYDEEKLGRARERYPPREGESASAPRESTPSRFRAKQKSADSPRSPAASRASSSSLDATSRVKAPS